MPDRFVQMKRGYDPQEVDKYIDALEAVIKSYKEKDSAIKNAILSAQIAADNIVKNANIQVVESKSQTLGQIKAISVSVAAQRAKILEFQQEYNALMEKYVKKFNESDMQELLRKIESLEKFVAKLGYDASEIGPPETDGGEEDGGLLRL